MHPALPLVMSHLSPLGRDSRSSRSDSRLRTIRGRNLGGKKDIATTQSLRYGPDSPKEKEGIERDVLPLPISHQRPENPSLSAFPAIDLISVPILRSPSGDAGHFDHDELADVKRFRRFSG